MQSFVRIFLVTVLCAGWVESSIDLCLDKDSIKCLQLQIYKSAKTYLNKSNIELGGGVSIKKKEDHSRSGKSLVSATETKIMTADSVDKRQTALFDYLGDEMENWWNGATLTWNPKTLIKDGQSDSMVEEGRGRRKRRMQKIMPYLIMGALKITIIGIVSLLVTGLIAKKALLAGMLSIFLSGFVSLRGLLQSRKKQQIPHYLEGHNAPHYAQGSFDYGQNLVESSGSNQPAYYANFVMPNSSS